MPERVIGYTEVEIEEIIARPVDWGAKNGGFHELAPIRARRTVLRPIYENLGPRVFTTLDAPELPRYTDLSFYNTNRSKGE